MITLLLYIPEIVPKEDEVLIKAIYDSINLINTIQEPYRSLITFKNGFFSLTLANDDFHKI